jgi:hypothetical protein
LRLEDHERRRLAELGHRWAAECCAWRTFLQAHWPALVAADFFTTEVWTARGLVRYYTAFVIELHTRRVAVLGSTPNPAGAFVVQAVRSLLGETDTVLREGRILLCDRDPLLERELLESLLARWRPGRTAI